jgi:hypothetical protein
MSNELEIKRRLIRALGLLENQLQKNHFILPETSANTPDVEKSDLS